MDYPDVCGMGIVKCKVNGFFFFGITSFYINFKNIQGKTVFSY